MTYLTSQAGRQWIYGIVVSIFPILVIYGWIADDNVPHFIVLASAILGLTGTASAVKSAVYKTRESNDNYYDVEHSVGTASAAAIKETPAENGEALNTEMKTSLTVEGNHSISINPRASVSKEGNSLTISANSGELQSEIADPVSRETETMNG